ncbi:putative DNA polymerase beta-like domain, DNA polymerase lambda lyase domain superfamily [Plasmopara halstedii]
MKTETAISDLILKCEEQGIRLPKDPWHALRVTIAALQKTKNQALGYLQISKALDQLENELSNDAEAMDKIATKTLSSRPALVSKRSLVQERPTTTQRDAIASDKYDHDFHEQDRAATAKISIASGMKKTKRFKKSRIQEQAEATPAVRDENQSLVNQLVKLGEYEMINGYTQRGLARLRAAKEICGSPHVITSGAQAKKLDHVGPVVATKVDQLLNEGLAAALSEYDGLPVTK